MTYIQTHEGGLYLGRSWIYSRNESLAGLWKELVLDALLMAVWHRKPQVRMLVYSDQGSQYTRHD
jgi:putative transposase